MNFLPVIQNNQIHLLVYRKIHCKHKSLNYKNFNSESIYPILKPPEPNNKTFFGLKQTALTMLLIDSLFIF